MNVKQQMLNEQAEVNAVYNMFGVLHEVMQSSFDYSLVSAEPKSLDAENKNWEIPMSVNVTANQNMDFCAEFLINSLSVLSLSEVELENYRSLNKQVFPVTITYIGKSNQYFLRKETSFSIINSFASNWGFYTRLFKVESGDRTTHGLDHKNLNPRDIFKCIGNKENFNFVNGKSLVFFTKGQQVASFNWQDKYTLSEIENITGFNVKPEGIVSNFKQGGYVLYEENGHGLVFTLSNVAVRWRSDWNPPSFSSLYGWEEANLVCEELIMNGFSDWRLPTGEEMKKIQELFQNQKIGNFNKERGYWTSTKAEEDSQNMAFVALFISNGEPTPYFPIQAGFAIRAVRSF